jgi:uncharacterized membrane-anchored protein YhcB (DUF1043 family)
MSQTKNLIEFTNWLSFTHDEYISAMQMGKYNYDSIQLAAEWWTFYLERKYLEGQQNIVYFMVAMFRLVNKYVIRGGIGHMAKKGNENVEALLQTATKIESISFKGVKQPNIKFIKPGDIRSDSWENQFDKLAVDMMLNPEKYPKGYEVDAEKSYSSPIALTALKICLRTLETAIRYEKKRKVITKMEKVQDDIKTHLEDYKERVDEFFLKSATHVNDQEKRLQDLEKHAFSSIESLKGRINLGLTKQFNQQLDEAEMRVDLFISKVNDLPQTVKLVEKQLENQKMFKGFFGRRYLRKLLKTKG